MNMAPFNCHYHGTPPIAHLFPRCHPKSKVEHNRCNYQHGKNSLMRTGPTTDLQITRTKLTWQYLQQAAIRFSHTMEHCRWLCQPFDRRDILMSGKMYMSGKRHASIQLTLAPVLPYTTAVDPDCLTRKMSICQYRVTARSNAWPFPWRGLRP